jgi:transposase
MPNLEITHQSVRDYIAAKKRGDRKTTDRIIAEASARFATRTTDGSEMAELYHATMHVRFGEDL